MSIATEITRINNAKAALKTAIEGKGVTVPESTTLDGYAALVDAISGGGSATLITKTITENGTYDAEDDSADGYSEVTVNVQPPQEAHSKDVNFYDYDGKILYSYTAAEFANLTALPANPTHSGLTSQGWNWTLADAKAQVTAVGACDIGQMYVTSDGKTRLYCTFEEFNKSFYFGLGVNGTVTIDWGDGSSTSTLTGTNNGTVKNVQHTYADAGDYVITLEIGSGGSFAFFGYSQCGYLFKGNTSNVYANRAYARCLKKIEMGTGAYMRNYGLSYCVNLETVTVNNNAFLGSTALFAGCTKLKFVTIPNSSPIGNSLFQFGGVMEHICLPKTINSNTVGNNLVYYNFNIKRLVLPDSVTTIGTTITTYSISLFELYLSNNITSIASSAFTYCHNLKKITIPASVTSIATKAFQGCYGVTEYHFKSTTPPTLDNVDAFNGIADDCVIYVPSAKLNDYKTASNWSTYASYMVGE